MSIMLTKRARVLLIVGSAAVAIITPAALPPQRSLWVRITRLPCGRPPLRPPPRSLATRPRRSLRQRPRRPTGPMALLLSPVPGPGADRAPDRR